ncbi:LodA/GoxA family CTQ-dependent oxidase [Leucothrix pacifica]|uniref:LodA/GoxA family CTQ-dependent oxidase n=1 Tax=Leucothrix pacifica TaxID=1247513 RepID=UPI0015E86300|nr:LodA/GoxA family CTQ-dependent oxidase [Leucothrix pacifica]
MKDLLSETVKSKETSQANCKSPADGLESMFVDQVQKTRVEKGNQCPARRPVFLRTHGAIKGELVFQDDIPTHLQHGLFANPSRKHPVWLRYSSDLIDGRPDYLSTIGLGIKLFDVPGEKCIDQSNKNEEDNAETADLLFQNVPYFFVDTAEDMCGFTQASLEGLGDEWIQKKSPITKKLLKQMQQNVSSVLQTVLWSVIPFKLGNGYCKYLVKPNLSSFANDPDINDPNYLGKDLVERLKAGPAGLDLYIQPRPDSSTCTLSYLDEHFPLDRATVVWDEDIAKPIKVASIHIEQQDISEESQQTYGDWLAFNVGRVPLVNAPVGSIAEARMQVYQASANYRREKNNQPMSENSNPNEQSIKNPVCPFAGQTAPPKASELTSEQIDCITHVRIHPGIGVSRIGNSQSEYTIGPEVMNPKAVEFGETRDKTGAIKRQAARFRLYGYDKHGQVVAEVQHTAETPIEWAVHVANKKAQWYEFDTAMDLVATQNVAVGLRNPSVKKADHREALSIDPGQKKISGISMRDGSYRLTGDFQGTPVTLGELRTDAVGRLLFLPGHGVSASPESKPVYDPDRPGSFNNAAGWYDDIADGPVQATVRIGGRQFDADPAWVVSAPPNYAPDLVSWRTMDDLMRRVMMQAGIIPLPQQVSFTRDIQPVLQRLSQLQWVNKGFLSLFGAGSPMNFADPELLKRLSKVPESRAYPDPYQNLRRSVYHYFRSANGNDLDRTAYPPLYGDTFGYTDDSAVASTDVAAHTYLRVPDWFEHNLKSWVEGRFVDDYHTDSADKDSLEETDLQQRPEMLDRAALHFCLADAFHPGCELTWPMRHASMYRAPYRIRMRPPGKDAPMYPSKMTQAEVLKMGGPLYEQGPGDLTRWMAIPWQGDTAFCRSGYDMEYDPYVPAYWPARVPNQVLTKAEYKTLCDKSLTTEERTAAFYQRASWDRQLPKDQPAPEQMQYVIDHFGELGIVEAMPRPTDYELSWLPDVIYVENLTSTKAAELKAAHEEMMTTLEDMDFHDKQAAEAGWFNAEQRDEFATIKRRGR